MTNPWPPPGVLPMPGVTMEPAFLSILQSIKEWDDWMDVTLAPKTRRLYRRTLVNLLADTLPVVLTEKEVVAYLRSLPAKGAMRGVVLRTLHCYYKWRGGENPVARLKVPKPKIGPAPTLAPGLLERLLIAAAWRSPKRAWAILLMYVTGARITAFCALRAEDIEGDLDTGPAWVHFRVTKGDRPYTVALGRVGREAARELIALKLSTLIGCGPGRMWQYVNEAARDAEIKCWPHLLRHEAATTLYETCHDPLVVRDFLGHADLSQIPRYVHGGDERLRAGVESAGF
jgi:integrase